MPLRSPAKATVPTTFERGRSASPSIGVCDPSGWNTMVSNTSWVDSMRTDSISFGIWFM